MKKTVETRTSVDKGSLCYTVDLPWIVMTIARQQVIRASVDKGRLCYTVDLGWIVMSISHRLVMRLKGWYMKTLIA
jgi:hypothetical protein